MDSVGASLRTLWRLALGVCGALAIANAAQATASTKIGVAPLMSPSAADSYYGSATTHTNSTGAAARPAEVQELARALKNDPDLIYEYVRNNTVTVWTYGLTKGAMGVIVDRAGTAFDQAHLMVELLRQSGYTTSYNFGTITLTGAQFQAWTGITSATAACQLLSSGGIPAAINGSTLSDCSYGSASITTIDVSHAWVSVVIGGVSYAYDPAYKDHTFTTGMNLATATGMTSGTMAGVSATTGTTSGVNYIQSVANSSSSGVTSNLNTYAANLDTAISALNGPGVADVVGGQTINAQAIPSGGLRQLSLPYTTNVLRTVSGDIPDQYRTSLRVQVNKARPGGSSTLVIDKTVYVDDVYGWRLVFDPNFDTSGATFNGTLKLIDDFGTVNSLATTGSYSDDPTYSRGAVTLTANLPYAANSGAYMDASVTRTLTYALPFAIVHGWGDQGRGLVEKWGARRDAAMPAAPDSTCKVCFVSYKAWKGDGRRDLIVAEWLAEASKAGKLNAAIAQSIFAQHYAIGFSSAETSVVQTPSGAYWITDSFDRLDVEDGFSVTSKSATALDRRAAILTTAGAISMLKGNVSAQVADLVDASSSANRFEWGNAPPSWGDPSGGSSRPTYQYLTATDTGNALALSRTENSTAGTSDTHTDSTAPSIGPTETLARRQAVANAVSAYVSAGFNVVASSEAFLGPGQRAGGFVPTTTSGSYTHNPTPQRGGALVATRYDANGDPLEIAHVAINPTDLIDGGGGGAQIFHQMEYDPATAADAVRARFVTPQVGSVSAASAAKLVIGAGSFPLTLVGQLTWRDGDVREETYGPGAHREPQGGWTSAYHNTLTVSGSGLEGLGETDVRGASGAIAAFYAAQDLYRSSPSLKREVVGELIMAWWGHTLTQNVVTVAVGTSTQQFLRKPSGVWFSPGPGVGGTLTQTNAPSISPRHPNGYSNCTTQMLTYVPTMGWSYAGVTFAVTSPKGDVQTFGDWTNQMVDTTNVICAEQRGLRMSTWSWPTGQSLTFSYSRPSGYTTQMEVISNIATNLHDALFFTNGGFGGFSNNRLSPALRQLTVSTSGSQTSHTDPISAVTKFDISTTGTGDYAKLRLQNVYAADDGTNPSIQYVRDTLARVSQRKDKLALAGTRAPTQYFLANGLRTETLNAAGYSSILYADLKGRPTRAIDAAGTISTTAYDGRGRATTVTSPDGEQVQTQYNDRNLKTQVTRLAAPASAEAGQTIVTQFGWDPTLANMIWSKDPTGAQTDYGYSGGALTGATYPPASTGATRLTSHTYFYPTGQDMGLTAPLGQAITATYSGDALTDLNNTVGGLSGDMVVVTSDWFGDPTDIKNPLSGHYLITRDLLRRPTLLVEPGGSGGQQPATRSTYDVLGRTTKVERGTYSGSTFTPLQTSIQEFDAVGNRTKLTTPAGVTQYSYDAVNRVTCVAVRMNPNAYAALPADACAQSTAGPQGPDRISRYTYDAAGHVSQTEIGVGTNLQQVSVRYTYNAMGQMTSVTDANGNLSGFTYDGFNRFKRLYYPASPRGSRTASTTDYEENTYDSRGNVTALRRRDGTAINYQYDALNRITLKDLPGTTTGDVYFTYDDTNRKVSASFGSASNPVFVKSYDQAGRLVSDAPPAGASYSATFDNSGNLVQVGVNFDCTVYTYDNANRPSTVKFLSYSLGCGMTAPPAAPVVATISYDALNRRSAIALSNGVTTTYGYDSAGRLSVLEHATPTPTDTFQETVSYNAAGGLASRSQLGGEYVWSGQPSTTTNFTHNQLNQDAALAAASGYDTRGNLISDGTRSFTYDAESRLTGVSGGTAAITLAYDPWGRLFQTTVGSTVTQFDWGGQQLYEEGPAGSGNGYRDYIYDPAGGLIMWREGGGTSTDYRFLHQDRLGSIIAHSNMSGAVVPYTYGPYGEPQSWSGSRFRYTGQMAIPEAQLYHYRARAYDPMMGRFLQTDPIRYGDGPNIYAYVHGDPVNGTDPSGEVLVVNVFDSFGPGVVGHVGININNTNTIGFYPTTPAGWSSVTGTPGVWKQDDMSLPHTTYYINTTPAQDGELAGLLTAARYDPAQYSLLHCNCTTEVESLLAQVGVPTSAGSDNIPLVSNALFQSLELNYRGGCVACGGVRNRSLITLAARVLALAGPYIPADYVSGSGNTVICAACSYIYQAPPSTPQSPTPTIIPGDVFPDSPAGGDSGGGNCGGGGGGGGGPPTQDSGCVRPASYNIDRSSNPVPDSRKEVRLPAAGRPLDANWRPNPDRLYLRRLVA